jgi:hypothetical protein
LRDAPLPFWGSSRAGNWGPDFAALHPKRTIGFVLYQSAAGNREAASHQWVQELDGSHGDSNTYVKAHVVVIPWIAAVIQQRVSPDGKTLIAITDDSALLGK